MITTAAAVGNVGRRYPMQLVAAGPGAAVQRAGSALAAGWVGGLLSLAAFGVAVAVLGGGGTK